MNSPKANAIHLSCSLHAGWATIIIQTTYQAAYTVHASYLNDSLSDLLSACIMVFNGLDESECPFVNEPGETKLLLQRSQDDLLIKAYVFDNWTKRPFQDRSNPGVEQFTANVRIKAFMNAVVVMFNNLKKSYSSDVYIKNWGYPYPAEKVAKLRQLLGLTT